MSKCAPAGLRLVGMALVCLLVAVWPPSARGELRIDITQGVVEPMPIAIMEFRGEDAETKRLGRQIAEVVAADLQRSGLFRIVDRSAFIEDTVTIDTLPRFGDWRVINAEALVNGQIQRLEDGRLRVPFRLWDVFAEKQMEGAAFSTSPKNWRRVAHIIADAIYKRITGEKGYFDTRIVYIAETGPHDKRVKRLAIMDQDGENHRFLTDGESLVLTPRFSPTLQEITYLSYSGGIPKVYVRKVDEDRQGLVGNFPGMSFAPRFSPDGEKLIMSMAEGGNSEIYSIDVRTRARKRLTNNSAIDTSPSYSPDGRMIVFNSDRGGTQQLYSMDADGTNVRRISNGEGRYATPVWSPRGDLVAFTKIKDGRFFIGVMNPDGSGERLLTEGYHVEGPTWAPNGRVLMYFRKEPIRPDGTGGRSRLFSIDLTGSHEQEIKTPTDASDPAWSPLPS